MPQSIELRCHGHQNVMNENRRFCPKLHSLLMLALGFSSGLPFLLIGNTLGYWLRDENMSLTMIGLVSVLGLAYTLKVLWAPIVDNFDAPVFGFLGRRRGWILVTQVGVALSLFGIAGSNVTQHFLWLVSFAALAAISAAMQETVVDAWRIETARTPGELSALTCMATMGYRIAILATDALILVIADHTSWAFSYALFGVLASAGIVATLCVAEPSSADPVEGSVRGAKPAVSVFAKFHSAVTKSFSAFFGTYQGLAVLILMAIALYRLPDFLIGPIINPFYHDIGLSKSFVGEVRATFGLGASFAGIMAGTLSATLFGRLRALIVGGVLQALSISAFALLAEGHANQILYCAIMAADSFGTSFAGVALVVYMSSLTNMGYTATQYALLASSYALVGKILKIFSGAAIDALGEKFGLMQAYTIFFPVAGAIGVPAIVLFVLLARKQRQSVGTVSSN